MTRWCESKPTPGVVAAAISAVGLPPDSNWCSPSEFVGGTPDRSRTSGVNLIDSDYLIPVLRIALLQGRLLTREEVTRGTHGSHQQDICPALLLWLRSHREADPSYRAIAGSARLLQSPNMNQPYQVIGVVGDVRNAGLHRPIIPRAYIPCVDFVSTRTIILIRTTGNPTALLHAISTNIRALNQNAAVSFVTRWTSIFHIRLVAAALHCSPFRRLYLVALGLAAIGLAGRSFSVEQRNRQFGIRTALARALECSVAHPNLNRANSRAWVSFLAFY